MSTREISPRTKIKIAPPTYAKVYFIKFSIKNVIKELRVAPRLVHIKIFGRNAPKRTVIAKSEKQPTDLIRVEDYTNPSPFSTHAKCCGRSSGAIR